MTKRKSTQPDYDAGYCPHHHRRPPGPDTLTAQAAAVAHAQAADPFARVVVIADHPDAARSVLHWLGAQGAGIQ